MGSTGIVSERRVLHADHEPLRVVHNPTETRGVDQRVTHTENDPIRSGGYTDRHPPVTVRKIAAGPPPPSYKGNDQFACTITCTVEPVLKITCVKGPPVLRDHPCRPPKWISHCNSPVLKSPPKITTCIFQSLEQSLKTDLTVFGHQNLSKWSTCSFNLKVTEN